MSIKEMWEKEKQDMKKGWNDIKGDFKNIPNEWDEQKKKEAVKKEKRRNPEGGMRVFWLCMFWFDILMIIVCIGTVILLPLLIVFIPSAIWTWNNRIRGTKKNQKEVVVEKHYIYNDKDPEE